MAGNYPDQPSWRMAIDRDGTQLLWITSGGAVTQGTSANLRDLNDENGGTALGTNTLNQGYVVFIFPELRDIDGLYFQWGIAQFAASFTGVQVSTNTTNGIDGTWTSLGTTGLVNGGATKPDFRTRVASATVLAVRAVRLTLGSWQSNTYTWLYSAHIYGEPAPGQNTNRLELWHPTLDEKLPPAYLDWGDVPRSSSADRSFRVKNLSSAQTAKSVRVAMEILTDSPAPSVVGQHTLSFGGGSFVAQVNIGDLSPGAISPPVTLRRVTPSDAVLSLWNFRVFAESTDWQ